MIDASVALKWILQEEDSHVPQALACGDEQLLLPDFWLQDATSVMRLQVRRRLLTPDEAHQSLALLRSQVAPTPTADLALHDVALEIGITEDHSTCDKMYVAFAVAMGARVGVAADGPLFRAMRKHPNSAIAGMVMPLHAWAAA